MRWRVLRWHRTSSLIIINQTISELIVIGEIPEGTGETSGLVGGRLRPLAFFFPPLHSAAPTSSLASPRLPPNGAASAGGANTRQPRDAPLSQSCLSSPKVEGNGAKGHLKAKVNGEALLEPEHCTLKKKKKEAEVRLKTAAADKCECFSRGRAAL